MANERIKETAKEKKVCLWQVAERLNMQDSALSRKMRHELPEQEQAQVMQIITDIAAEREG